MFRAQPSDWLLGTPRKPGVLAPEEVLDSLPFFRIEAPRSYRELIKLASLAAALGDALRRRGTTGPTATLTAEAGIAVFRVAFERWVTETAQQELPQLIRESLEELRGVTAR